MKISTLASQTLGPNVLILGSIHGNERSGSLAIDRFTENIENRTIQILCGSVTLISDCNEEAGRRNIRYLESNLNRCFYEWQNLATYEGGIAREIMPYFDAKDSLLDLHSTSWASIPFLFSEKRNLEMAKKLWISHVITGWNDLSSASVAGDTDSYMNKKWGYGFTFESGNHESPEGSENAYQVLLNFLCIQWIISTSLFRFLPWEKKLVEMIRIHTCKTDNFAFALNKKELVNFSKISKWSLIATDGDEKIHAETDFILLMPTMSPVKKWEEVFFVGKTIE